MFKKVFYSHCFQQKGWLPMHPFARRLGLGDLCQIRQGRFQPLLNIDEAHLVENVLVSREMPLEQSGWELSIGVQQLVCESHTEHGRDSEQQDRTKQLLEFSQAGDFIFHAKAPKAKVMLNWAQIRDDLTLKLTQLHYGFRHVYVITGVATADDWGLAVAGQRDARLELSAPLCQSNRFGLFSHSSARADRCMGIASYDKAGSQPAYFFKAKKLITSDAMGDRYLSQLVDNSAELAPDEVANWLQADWLDMVKVNELNLATAIGFFNWVNMSLDDAALMSD
jgi:hypothetical protein